ncbi:TPA: hypothetical protein ACPZLZ_003933 [Yersinia enterocolitica]|uniref:hypothetical protein n=3 Tax=Yersinia enterocolitica TaxID=630 RepID=UPI0027E40712|nr:hypothetical protein [Yersinia enterocolitica]
MMDITKSREESRKQFEYEAGKALCLPTSIIELARKGDGYDHAFDSMNIMHPLNGWWHWWKASRESIEVDIDWPEANDDFWKEGEDGAYATGHTDGRQQTTDAVVKALRTAGIRIKGESE